MKLAVAFLRKSAGAFLWLYLRQFRCAHRLAAEPMSGRNALPLGVDLPDLLHHFEQARPSGDAAGFQRRGDGEADCLVRSGLVGHRQIANMWQ